MRFDTAEYHLPEISFKPLEKRNKNFAIVSWKDVHY